MQKISNHPIIVLSILAAITLAISFYSFFPTKLPSLQPNIPGTSQTPSISISPNVKLTIVAATQRPDYSLTLANEKGFKEMLDYLKVWGKTYKGKDTIPLNTVLIFLTDKKQTIEQKDDKGNIVFSYSLLYERDAVVITVYLPDTLLTGPAPSVFFDATVISIASKMGGTNKTIEDLSNNNLISGFFVLQSTKTTITPSVTLPATR